MDEAPLPLLTPIDLAPKKRRKRPEDKLQVSIWRDLRPLLAPEVVCWSSESRYVGRLEGARRRARGVVAGTPDMTFYWPHAAVALVELKVKGSYPDEDQRALHKRLRDAGVPVGVCRSLDELVQFLREQGCPMRVRSW